MEAQAVGPSNNYCSARVRLLLRAQSTIRLYIECIVVRGVIHYSFALHATIGLEAHHIVIAPRRNKSCGRAADKFGLRTWI